MIEFVNTPDWLEIVFYVAVCLMLLVFIGTSQKWGIGGKRQTS